MGTSQLTLQLPFLQNRDETDFLVAGCNEAAFRFVKNWRDWTSPVAILTGPQNSGKSHLAQIWRIETAARVFDEGCFDAEAWAATGENILIEDADRLAGQERTLFHLFNLAKERRTLILLTARRAPGHWAVSLPDLRSRLRSYPTAALSEPDDELLAAVLIKLFHDRQLIVGPDLVSFVLARVERSVQALFDFVERLDRSALAENRKVTRNFASIVLQREAAAHSQLEKFEDTC